MNIEDELYVSEIPDNPHAYKLSELFDENWNSKKMNTFSGKSVLTLEQAKRIQQETGLEQILIFGWNSNSPNQIQYAANKGDRLIVTLIDEKKNEVGIDRRFLIGIRKLLDYIEGNR